MQMKKKIIMVLSLCMLILFAVPANATSLTSPKITGMMIDSASGMLRVSWEAVEGADHYNLYMMENDTWKFLLSEEINTVPGSDGEKLASLMNFEYGKSYTLAVTAVKGDTESDKTGQTFAIITLNGFKTENVSGGIRLTWNSCAGATGFTIYRNGVLYKTLSDGASVSFLDTSVTKGTSYTYRIIPSGSTASYSGTAGSNEASIVRLTAPKLSSVKGAKKSVTVRWKKVTGAKYYQVSYAITGKTAKIKKVSGGKLTCKISKLKKGKKYQIKVRAVKGSSYSAWSSVKTVKVK